ncbi:hypothetical protein Sfum_3857 [Syntrophobacter fumaroxidans MPOB]|uniref:Uncharacterized protein n=1 Tax=Syntrophobacter fumaroxidans (strain DSM 10017 / MPOB) TaxID=335543 RepID=A0LQ24_SYNFM|nr:hypothetical protein Sfum_3857 [Syntrophobacter fumaroxidans MPOB]
MTIKPTITVADNGNLQLHIPMLIPRMRGCNTVTAPQAQDAEIPGAQDRCSQPVRPALSPTHDRTIDRPGVDHQRRLLFLRRHETGVDNAFFRCRTGDFEKHVRLRHRAAP